MRYSSGDRVRFDWLLKSKCWLEGMLDPAYMSTFCTMLSFLKHYRRIPFITHGEIYMILDESHLHYPSILKIMN